MKKLASIFCTILIFISISSFAQSVIELSFTGKSNGLHIDLDSVKVINLSRDGDTLLVWPDTVLIFGFVGIQEESNSNGFRLGRAFPNPTQDKLTFEILIPYTGEVAIEISDLQGRNVISEKGLYNAGVHTFNFYPSQSSFHIINVCFDGQKESLKVLSENTRGDQCRLEYHNNTVQTMNINKSLKSEFIFIPGDNLLNIGYYSGSQSGLTDGPFTSEDYVFEFAMNVPCPDAPYVIYEGQYYNTVQIAGQCWMKENLSVGTMIQGNQEMGNNGIIEKYCVGNNPDSCDHYGGLYQWEEAMAYENKPGAQGICPPGWHIPSDIDWIILEGTADSQYPINDSIWEQEGPRGFDAGSMLKSTSEWIYYGAGSNKSGFTAIGTGMRNMFGSFTNKWRHGYHWSSTEQLDWIWVRSFNIYGDGVDRRRDLGVFGFTVRCLKDI